jgi:hypothetical protein
LPRSFSKWLLGGYPQISIGRCIVEHLKSAKQPVLKIGRDVSGLDVFDKKGP